jgi:murein DD-endopeptidase MepM/ murein hydrolase activator NlpD
MEEDQQRVGFWASFRESLQNNYRLVVMNSDTFEEVRSLQLTLLNVYVAITSLLVVIALTVALAIAYTPLRKYIPGYGDVVTQEEFVALQREMSELEEQLAVYAEYNENVRNILVGDVRTAEDLPSEPDSSATSNANEAEVNLSEEEIALRREMELERVGRQARAGRTLQAGSDLVPLEQMYFIAPLTGEISAGFDTERNHLGIDILAPKNTAVKAAMDGYVFFSDWTRETGNTIGIQHDNNVITFYKHNAELLKPTGSRVSAGEAIAIIGNTGHLTTGPHLHFELWHRGEAVNPTQYVAF